MTTFKLPNAPYKKELTEYSKAELIVLFRFIEEQFISKRERLRDTSSKLVRARTRLQSQKQSLQHLRMRVVELTSPQPGHEQV
jgi:hypothetical protein